MSNMPLNDPKLRNLIMSAMKCLQCEICRKESEELLPGLCASHMFCKPCAKNNLNCPSCKATFSKKNADVTFVVSPEFFPALHDIEEILKEKKKYELTPAKVPVQKVQISETTIEPSSSSVASPAKSELSLFSTPSNRVGRRSILGSPMPDVNKRNSKGETLVHAACIKKNFEEVKRLLSLGANCCVRDYNGWTPLHEAAQKNRVDIAQKLLEHGAKVNASGGEEYLSPLHDAVSAGFIDMVKLLLKFGANPNQISIKGETPKDMTKDATILALLDQTEFEPPLSVSEICTLESAIFSDGRPLFVISSGLDKNHKSLFTSFVKTFSGKIAAKPSGDLKAVIAAEENNLCQRSAAVLAGIASGAWIVRPEWLKVCLENNRLIDPEIYELYGTTSSNNGQVFKKSRINTESMLPGLFAGCHFFFSNIENYGADLTKDSVVQLVKVMGGRVLSRSPDPEDTSGVTDIPFHADTTGPLANCSHYIIFEKGKTKKNFIEFNMKHIKALQYSWLLSCIENFKLLDP